MDACRVVVVVAAEGSDELAARVCPALAIVGGWAHVLAAPPADACEEALEAVWGQVARGGGAVVEVRDTAVQSRQAWPSLARACAYPEPAGALCVWLGAAGGGQGEVGADEGFEEVVRVEHAGQVEQALAGLIARLPEHQPLVAHPEAPDHPSSFAPASVQGKMQCVYQTRFVRGDDDGGRGRGCKRRTQGRCVALPHVRPEAREMLETGSFVPTVKVHGRCCRWQGGEAQRRLDINLLSGNERSQSKRKSAELDEFVQLIAAHHGYRLDRCWQAGPANDWSWKPALARNWGWIRTNLHAGWRPSSPPDPRGHWIGYRPVRHLDGKGGVLEVNEDGDVRLGFDEARRRVFTLEWQGSVLGLREVDMAHIQDGSYELIGPRDTQGGAYQSCLPSLPFPSLSPFGPSSPPPLMNFFVRHGSVTWREPFAPPNPLDFAALHQWMAKAGVEGVVWHGTGRFQGRMYKCHVGHMDLDPVPRFSFRSDEHVFEPPVRPPEPNDVARGKGQQARGERDSQPSDPGKLVVLLRHGRSEAQDLPTRLRLSADKSIRDAGLSRAGEKQATAVKLWGESAGDKGGPLPFGDAPPELVVVSPLTRALATMQLVLRAQPKADEGAYAVIAHPALQEFAKGLSGQESVGRPWKELESEGLCTNVDVSLLGDRTNAWWEDPSRPTLARIDGFLQWLQQRSERRVLVVAHSNVIHALLGGVSSSVPNCVPLSCCLNSRGQLQPTVIGRAGSSENSDAKVRVRVCRVSNQKDVRVVVVERRDGVVGVVAAVQGKWKRRGGSKKGVRVLVEGGDELTNAHVAARLKDGDLLMVE